MEQRTLIHQPNMNKSFKPKLKTTGNKDWSWKESEAPKYNYKHRPVIQGHISKSKKRAEKRKKKKGKRVYRDAEAFFRSGEWLRLRYRVLKKYGGACMLCGRTYRDDKIKIHIDHIKPRSKFPELELVFDNLQVLCEDCNLGKLNLDFTDWRPASTNDQLMTDDEMAELELAHSASSMI